MSEDKPSKAKNEAHDKSKKKSNAKSISKKQKVVNSICIILVVISLTLSGYNNHIIGNSEEKKIENSNPLIDFVSLSGTHGCEKGGFSMITGIDSNGDEELGEDEVLESRNICHGTEGDYGPRGYPGENGTDGLDGADGTDGSNGIDGNDGNSSFISSYSGEIWPCPNGVVIEMGNNSNTEIVDSEIKMCMSDLFSGRITDIGTNSANSFTTGCSEGGFVNDLLIVSATTSGFCKLFVIDGEEITPIGPGGDFQPGFILGYTEYEDWLWFDGMQSSQRLLFATNGTNVHSVGIPFPIQQGDSLVRYGDNLVLVQANAITPIEADGDIISGSFSNATSANDVLIYNSGSGIVIDNVTIGGELNSDVTFSNGYYYFFATSDVNGIELHRSDGVNLERISLTSIPSQGPNFSPMAVGDSILFEDDFLFAYNTINSTVYQVDNTMQSIGITSDPLVYNNMAYFDCATPETGRELCYSNGIESGVIADHNSGITSSDPKLITEFNGEIFLIIEDVFEGDLLCRIDGSALEILYDHDISDTEAGQIGDLWFSDHMVYYIGDTLVHGAELYARSHGDVLGDWIIIQ